MRSQLWKRAALILGGLVALIAGWVVIWLMQEVECHRFDSPDGKHTAIVTCRRVEAYLPAFPGQSGDRPGFIRIEDREGWSYGRVSIPMVWMARDLEWTNNGANLKLVCEWDFAKREYRFWNKWQTREIVEYAEWKSIVDSPTP